MPSTSRTKKRRSSSSKREGFSLRSVETLFSRQLMRVIGILFLGASLWFAANSTDTIFKVAKNLISPKELIVKKAPSATSAYSQTETVVPVTSSPITFPMVLIVCALILGWAGLQLLTRWRRRAEFQIISVFLVFIALLAIIRNYGWHVELLFSLLVIVAVGLYFAGNHLSHTATRIHFLFTWGLFILWWLLKIMIGGQEEQVRSLFIMASVIFLTFHLILLFRGFAGRKTLSHYMEVFAIVSNLGIYFILVSGTILKFYGRPPLFFFALALSACYILTLFAMEYTGKPFRKVPFLVTALLLVSLLLPLLFWQNELILLAGSLSLLLLLYSGQTKDQPSIIAALGLVVVMALLFSKDLVFSYVPAAFRGGLAGNAPLFYKGMVSGLFLALVAYLDRFQLKKLEIKYSRKWFSRRRYMLILKMVFLAGLYFGLFLLWQYSVLNISGYEEAALISWFSFHCLFCVICIPWLAAQRSSLLSFAILVSVIMTIVYPSLLTIQNAQLADLYIRSIPAGLAVFPMHYAASFLFLVYMAVVLQYTGRAFKGNNLAKRLFLVYAVVMVLYIAISEMVLTRVVMMADSPIHSTNIIKQSLGLPTSATIFLGGIILLIWGFIRHKRFGRTLALILILLAAFKLIYFDLKSISLFSRVILLFAAGSVFLGLSLGYNRARRTFRKKRKRESPVRTPRFQISDDTTTDNPET